MDSFSSGSSGCHRILYPVISDPLSHGGFQRIFIHVVDTDVDNGPSRVRPMTGPGILEKVRAVPISETGPSPTLLTAYKTKAFQ